MSNPLFVPDRFDDLRTQSEASLRGFVIPIEASLSYVDRRFGEMASSRRGALAILRGDSGSGKSTFLETLHLFRQDVSTNWIPRSRDIEAALEELEPTETPRVVALEGREAIGRVSDAELEAALHAINAFVREPRGRNTLFVWPTNTDPLTDQLVALARDIGDDALLGVRDPIERFTGPAPTQFPDIARRTIERLNEGASFSALGISEERTRELAKDAKTIGRYLGLIREDMLSNMDRVAGLLREEQVRMWTLVIAGNDPEGDVDALTRGSQSYVDIDKLVSSTDANIVKDLKSQPEIMGVLGTSLEARVIWMEIVTALAVIREYADEQLRELMVAHDLSTKRDKDASGRLENSHLALLLKGQTLGTRKRGPKARPNTRELFARVAAISQSNDIALNRALARGLQSIGAINGFELEKPLRSLASRKTDIYCETGSGPVRLEVMWRQKTGRATIAIYILTKLSNYGRAVGLLK
jgi:hypothetical protein